jgi:hypothetical protein
MPPTSQRAAFPAKEENLDNGHLNTPDNATANSRQNDHQANGRGLATLKCPRTHLAYPYDEDTQRPQ